MAGGAGGRLVVMGGADHEVIHNQVEVYDPDTNTWALAASMHGGRRGGACASFL